MSSARKSFVKMITWRIIATLTTMALVLFFTGEIELALTVGALETVAKMILYYFHERFWSERMVKK